MVAPLLCLLWACGGSAGNRTNETSAGPGSPPGQVVPVTVSSGQTASGIDITVSPPVASPAPNAQDLGVGGGFAFGTGAQIHRGQTTSVFLFGPGLSASMRVRISGPTDISISNVRGISATDGTPGVEFTAAAGSDAALGGRTVFLTNLQNDITAFTGGLEVVE